VAATIIFAATINSAPTVLSGVPQGSVLGPILFLVFINNLDAMAHLSTEIKKFADDAKLGQVISSQTDSICLQECLDKMTEWAE
jgi:ribonuclease P/MRP protein subunit RPP40